jgi:hypothetical protein
VSGVAVAAGPITGGWLLEHFWWGSVFFINLPIAAVVLTASWLVVPESSEHDAPKLDWAGVGLSVAAIGTLVFTIIEAPEFGWLDIKTIGGFAIAAVLIGVFVRWELKIEQPMLPVSIFKNLRFSAASVSITSAFFALFGFIFLITQYFQLIRGYGPFEAGVRMLPVAISIAVAAVLSPLAVQAVGTTQLVRAGLAMMSAAFLWIGLGLKVETSYMEIVGQMVLLGLGLGATTAPATESIMESLHVGKAGIGSAVNDTTRELGGTLGVAIIGSVFSSLYVSALNDAGGVFAQLPPEAQHLAKESVAAAGIVARDLGADAPAFLNQVNDAFLSGLGVACFVAAGVAFAGALFASRFLPARA